MKRACILGLSLTLLLSGCSSTSDKRRPEFTSGFPTYDCPPHLEAQTRILAEVFPLADVHVQEYSIKTIGARARRIMLTLEPAGLSADDTIVWSSTTVSSLGGTFSKWTRLQSRQQTLEPMSTQPTVRGSNKNMKLRDESASVVASPGQLRITRIAQAQGNLVDALFVDVTIMPGGSVVDDIEVSTQQLWDANGQPRSPDVIGFNVTPVRHPPGLDVVEGLIEATFVVRVGRTGEEWACSANTRVTLVDRDAVRLPYWDVGFAPKNAARQEWLALFDPARGAIRPIFSSPEAANAFANWLQLSKPTHIAGYTVGAFKQRNFRQTRPYGVVNADSMGTFRPIAADDFSIIRAGAVGEP